MVVCSVPPPHRGGSSLPPPHARRDLPAGAMESPMSPTFYSFDPDQGVQRHDTELAARGEAIWFLDVARTAANEGWVEEVVAVEWGIFLPVERVIRTRYGQPDDVERMRDRGDESTWDLSEFDEYALLPVPEPPLSQRAPIAWLSLVLAGLCQAVLAVERGEAPGCLPAPWTAHGRAFRWHPGGSLIAVVAPAKGAERVIGSRWSSWRQGEGTTFHDYALEAIWQAEDPGWDARQRGEG